MEVEPKEEHARRGIYLLPNLFTTAALFAGFYAVVAAMKGLFEHAAIAIFIAMIMDSLDGRVARLTHTQSAFGAEYDSLSDMTSFGVAPALVAYSWGLSSLGKLGWLAAFLYTACVALRLARFNTQIGTADKRFFQGLPSPAGAAMVASMVWVGNEYGISGHAVNIMVAVIVAMTAGLMVSNFRYWSFKELELRGKVPFVAILVTVLIFVGISIDPPEIICAGMWIYAISGPIVSLMRMRQARKRRIAQQATHQNPS